MLESLFSLEERVALVAGAGGLGTGMAVGLAKAGAAVVTADVVPEHAEKAAEAVSSSGAKSFPLTFDIRDRGSIEALVDETLSEMGQLDILINSSGISRMGHAVDLGYEDWQAVIDVFLSGVFWCCQAAARKAMIPQGYGKIINIASISGMVVTGNRGSSYCTAKAGVIQLSRALGTEWAEHGINVNAISPGYMLTPLTEGFLGDPKAREELVRQIPKGRIGYPEDLAGAAVFLASDASDYITADNLVVDGGYTAM
jgi:NAD(P)-dependent dehydrogenase (short-subunit alcohol dehydrogenase family)